MLITHRWLSLLPDGQGLSQITFTRKGTCLCRYSPQHPPSCIHCAPSSQTAALLSNLDLCTRLSHLICISLKSCLHAFVHPLGAFCHLFISRSITGLQPFAPVSPNLVIVAPLIVGSTDTTHSKQMITVVVVLTLYDNLSGG